MRATQRRESFAIWLAGWRWSGRLYEGWRGQARLNRQDGGRLPNSVVIYRYVRHESFEWDPKKAAANLAKHQTSFEDAAHVLADSLAEWFHVEQFDGRHSTRDEDRWITIGSYPQNRNWVLVISWTLRGGGVGPGVTRIISARHATKAERRQYGKRKSW